MCTRHRSSGGRVHGAAATVRSGGSAGAALHKAQDQRVHQVRRLVLQGSSAGTPAWHAREPGGAAWWCTHTGCIQALDIGALRAGCHACPPTGTHLWAVSHTGQLNVLLQALSLKERC